MFKYTRAVASNLLEDIKRICFITLIIVQSIFIIFYAYSIFKNFNNSFFLITYSVLFLISITSFVLSLIKNKRNAKTVRKFSVVKNSLKYITNATMLVFNIIEMIRFGTDDFSKVLLVVSGITLTIQIIIELVKFFIEKYFNDFISAIEKDAEFLNYLNPTNWKSTALKIIDAPLEKLAQIKGQSPKKISKKELILKAHLARHRKKIKDQKVQKIIQKKEKRAQAKKAAALAVQNELAEIKSHWKTIFGKNKKAK